MESLREVVREGIEFSLHGSSLRCAFDLPDDLAPVEVDRGQIHQVLNNLVINAIQASAEGGVLNVDARNVLVSRENPVATLEPGRYVRLTVRDNGTGIAPEHLARIFDPYFTTKSAGSGLGLATAYSIVKKHDGSMQADSEIGVGTAFHIYLPAATVSRAVPSGKTPAVTNGHARPPTAGKRARVLFMDDEVVLQELVGAMLEYLGYEVACAGNGEEALARFQEARSAGEPFAAVIVDLTVPGGMGGYETVQRLRALDSQVRAVVSSGYSNDPILAEYPKYRFSGVIAKPYQMVELGKVMADVIASPAQP